MMYRNTMFVLVSAFSTSCFGGMGSNIRVDNDSREITHLIDSTLHTLHLNGNINRNDFPCNFSEIIQNKWRGIIRKPSLKCPECTLGKLFIEFSRAESDEKRDYEHIDKSDFKRASQDLAFVLISLARKVRDDSEREKWSQQQNATQKNVVIPEDGMFAMELGE